MTSTSYLSDRAAIVVVFFIVASALQEFLGARNPFVKALLLSIITASAAWRVAVFRHRGPGAVVPLGRRTGTVLFIAVATLEWFIGPAMHFDGVRRVLPIARILSGPEQMLPAPTSGAEQAIPDRSSLVLGIVPGRFAPGTSVPRR